jgi:predicted Zn finger-like uncharacterized protein
MNVSCPQCSTTYRVDPAKVPSAGVDARCSNCSGVFRVSSEVSHSGQEETLTPTAQTARSLESAAPAAPAASETPPEAAAEGGSVAVESAAAAPATRPASPFGATDPRARAKRLARALVSDIVVYHPERRDRSRREGTLRQEFREEIRKSWEEYVAQVGSGFAKETPFFRDALNEILAGGERVF